MTSLKATKFLIELFVFISYIYLYKFWYDTEQSLQYWIILSQPGDLPT